MARRGWPKGKKLSASHKRAISRAMLARSKHTGARNKVARARKAASAWGKKSVYMQKVHSMEIRKMPGASKKSLTLVTHRRAVTRKELAIKGGLLVPSVALGSASIIAAGAGRLGVSTATRLAYSVAIGAHSGYTSSSFRKRPGRVTKIRKII